MYEFKIIGAHCITYLHCDGNFQIFDRVTLSTIVSKLDHLLAELSQVVRLTLDVGEVVVS